MTVKALRDLLARVADQGSIVRVGNTKNERSDVYSLDTSSHGETVLGLQRSDYELHLDKLSSAAAEREFDKEKDWTERVGKTVERTSYCL
jgi:hypothetical protein